MTASTMRCSSAAKQLFVLAALLLLAVTVRADNIDVKSASVTLRDNSYSLDADLQIALTPTLEDILSKGVSLYFLLEFELIRPRWYWLNDKVVTFAQRYKLAYNPLTRQYRISIGTIYQNFPTLAEAIRFLSRPRNIPVAAKAELQTGTEYSAAVRMRLDESQLPRPFQITVLGSREWNMRSNWFHFSVSP